MKRPLIQMDPRSFVFHTSRFPLFTFMEVCNMQQTITHSTSFIVGQKQTTVLVVGYFYAVDLGEHVRPRHHRVDTNEECTCSLGCSCPAVDIVRSYLAGGGQHAERPPFGYYPVRPAKCPVCDENTFHSPILSSPKRGAGWTCPSGTSHYWQHRTEIIFTTRKLAAQGKIV